MKIRVVDPDRKQKVINAVSHNTIKRFNYAMDEISEVLVGRTPEIEALKLCIVTRSHLMLEGKHGIAKSLLADEAFSRITGAVTFKKQFMKGTQTDEVLGPMNSKRYRDEAIWEHNTAGMLPQCHFFFADEVYRASDQALPVMMGILNEREFINGGIVQRCPLITAIGTTNFITDGDELDAFHDRWQVRIKSLPLTASSDVRIMLRRAMEEPRKSKATVTLAEIVSLNEAVKGIKIPEEMLDILPQVFEQFSHQCSGLYISDRRKVQALKFMQASALLSNESEVGPEHAEACRYIMTDARDVQQGNAWATTLAGTLGEYTQAKAENGDLRKLEKYTAVLISKYDPDKGDKKELKSVHDECKKVLAAINNEPPEAKPKSQRGVERMGAIVQKLEELLQDMAQKSLVF